MIADAPASPETFQNHAVAKQGPVEVHLVEPGISADYRIADLAAADPGALFYRDIGSDLTVLQDHSIFDVDRVVDRHPRVARPAGSALGQQNSVGLQQSVQLAAIIPATDLGGQNPLPMLDHPLESIGQVPLALVGRIREHVVDALPQAVRGLDVIEPDIGQLRDRGRGLLDYAGHVTLRVGDHHSEALIVLHLLGPDDPVRIGPVDEGEVRLEDGIDKNDQHRPFYIGPRQVDSTGSAVLNLLLDVTRWNPVAGSGKGFDLLLQVTSDEDQLGDIQTLQPVHDPIHH